MSIHFKIKLNTPYNELLHSLQDNNESFSFNKESSISKKSLF